MTQQTFEGTELAAVRMPDGVIGFGLAEVAYLLARHEDSDEARWARELIGLDDLPVGDDFLRSGASSLVARGLLTQRSDERGARTVSLADAAVMEYVLGASSRWIQIRMVNDEGPDEALIGIAPAAIGVLQPRMIGAWLAGFSGAVDEAPRLVLDVVGEIRQLHPESSIGLLATVSGRPAGSIYLRYDNEAARWDVVDRTSDPTNERRQWLDEFTVLGKIAALTR